MTTPTIKLATIQSAQPHRSEMSRGLFHHGGFDVELGEAGWLVGIVQGGQSWGGASVFSDTFWIGAAPPDEASGSGVFD